MLSLLKTLDSEWGIARQSLRQDLDTIETILNRRWAQTFGQTNILGVPAGGTGLASYAIGDLLYASAATTLSRLSIGAAGKILRSTGTLPAWSGFTIVNAFAQGDLIYASAANTLSSLAKNATASRYLSNTGAANSPAWAAVNLANGTTLAASAQGDVLYYSAADVLARLAKDTAATRYLSNTGGSNNPAWALVDVSNGVTGMAALTKVDDTNVTLTLGGTPGSALIRATSLTLGWTGTLGVTRGGSGTGTAFTLGSVIFAGAAGVYSQDNANFFWDSASTPSRLGIGTKTFGSGNSLLGLYRSSAASALIDFGYNASVAALVGIDAGAGNVINGSTDRDFAFRLVNARSFLFSTDNGSTIAMSIDSSGRVNIGNSRTATAVLQLKAGTATASTAPLKFTSGVSLTIAEAGAMEYNGTNLFFTRAGTVRENVLVAIDNVTAPTTNISSAIVNYYGSGAANYLGDPNRWLSVNILGTTYKIPLYT